MKAELFDGTVLEFEDGTPQEVIMRVVKQQTEQRRVRERVGTEKGRATLTEPMPVPEPPPPPPTRPRGSPQPSQMPWARTPQQQATVADMQRQEALEAKPVLDRRPNAGVMPAKQGDSVLSPEYVAQLRALMGKVQPEDRQRTLAAISQRQDVMGRAAREVLRQAGVENQGISLEDERIGERLRKGPAQSGAGGGMPAPAIPDVTPGFGDVMDLVEPADIASRRENALAVKNARTGQRAVSDRAQSNLDIDAFNTGTARELADVGVSAAGAVATGFKFLASAVGGADNPVSQALGKAEDFVQGFRSARAEQKQQRIGQIMESAKDEGVIDGLLAAGRAFGVAPFTLIAQGIGTTVPALLAMLLPGVRESTIGALATAGGVGGAMGAGAVKEGIFDAVTQELVATGMPEDEARDRAIAAQATLGENADQVALGFGLGLLAGATGGERFAIGAIRSMMGKGVVQPAAKTGMGALLRGTAVEGGTEFLQGGQEQLAANVALQREGFDVPTMRGVVSQGGLEGLAGLGSGAVMGGVNVATQRSPEQDIARAIDQGASDFARFFAPINSNVPPTQARAESVKLLDELAAEFGLAPKAVTAVREEASRLPAADVPEYLARAVQAMQKRGMALKPLDPEALQSLAQRLRPPEDAKKPEQPQRAEPAENAPEAEKVNQLTISDEQGAPTEPVTMAQADPAAEVPLPRIEGIKRSPDYAMARLERMRDADNQATKAAGRAEDAPAFEPREATDILSPKGTPWATKSVAAKKLRELGSGRLARVNTGWVIKTEEGAADAVDSERDGADGLADPGRSDGSEQLREQRDGELAADAEPADEPSVGSVGDAEVSRADGGRDADALTQPEATAEPFTTADTFTLGGKDYTVAKASAKSVTLKTADGKTRTVTPNSKTWATMLEQKRDQQGEANGTAGSTEQGRQGASPEQRRGQGGVDAVLNATDRGVNRAAENSRQPGTREADARAGRGAAEVQPVGDAAASAGVTPDAAKPQQAAEAQGPQATAPAGDAGAAAAEPAVPAAGTASAAVEGDGVAPAPAASAAPAPNPDTELVKVKTVFGQNTYVRRGDMQGDDNATIRMFTAAGKNNGRIARGNLDPDGSKRAALAAEDANNPMFNVITARGGNTFATQTAATRELNARGMQASHEVVPADKVAAGLSGFLVRRKADAAPTPNTSNPAPKVDTSPERVEAAKPAKRKPATQPPKAETPTPQPPAESATPQPSPSSLLPAEKTTPAVEGGSLPEGQGEAPMSALDAEANLWQRIAAGQATPDEFKAGFDAWVSNKAAIMAELSAKTKADLLKMGGSMFAYRYKSETKPEVVEALWRDGMSAYTLGRGYSYGMGAGSQERAVRAIVDGIDAEALAQYAAESKAAEEAAAARVGKVAEAIKDPKTLDDFKLWMRANMTGGKTFAEARMMLTPEQRAKFDELAATETRGQRKQTDDIEKTRVRVAGQVVDGDIIATKHTKKGTDLFVVKLSERVSREDYETLNAGAKRIGGYYSSFRGAGAVPGFQFTTREQAEAFVKLAQGDNAAAVEAAKERRDAFQDDRSQTAAERLTEMADRLDERASESLGRERKANTERRARFAANAEAAANADKAMATTMRRLATAITEGKAKFLDRVRQKVQVEALNNYVRTAKDAELRAKHQSYADQERHRGEPATGETADFAEFPSYTAYRSDLASLGRQLVQTEGTKKLGQQILKVADDVSDAYLKFAKENFGKVATFTTRDGGVAGFSTRDAAEAAIARSGYKGKAIAYQVKRGEHTIILSPSEAVARGVWKGDGDKRITLTAEFGAELVEKIGRANRRGAKVSVPWQFEAAYDRKKLLSRMGIESPAEFRAALREFIGLREAPAAPDKVKQLERAMIGRRNDGLDFFPTPESVADEMVAAADIQPGMRVLEPSAGMGHIAERIRAAEVEPEVGEVSADRRELLDAKGFAVVAQDFLALTEGGYDRILMNPPFSEGRDIQHVRHAYDLLKPGGRLVAIMGESAFTNQNKRATEFREWLESVGGTEEKLPEGTFNDPSLPVNTGANARMVVIEKPQGEAPAFSRPATPTNTQQIKAEVERTARAVLDTWATKPKLEVIFGLQDERVPERVRAEDATQRSKGATGEPEGFYYRGTIYVNASAVQEPAAVVRVMYHEGLGHAGLQGHFGPELDAVLDKMSRLYNQETLQKKAIQYGQAITDADGKFVRYASDRGRRVVAEEVLAELAETRPSSTWVKRAVAAIRNWLRENVPALRNLALSDAEVISQFLAPARGFIERGRAANGDDAQIVGTMFSRADQTQTPAVRAATPPAIAKLNRVMRQAGWEVDYVDMDLTGAKPKVDIRVNRGDGRFLIAKVDSIGRASFETFQRERNLRMDPKNPQARLAPHLDDTFLGRQRFEGPRAMLRSMVNYLTDNATGQIELADMRAAWAGVMAAPTQQTQALPAPDDGPEQGVLFSRSSQAPAPEQRPEAARAEATGKRSPLTGKPLIDVFDAAGNRLETSHIAATPDEALENYRQRPERQAAARAAAPAPTYAMPEAKAEDQGSNWRRVRGQEFTALDEPDGYLYHVTSEPAAKGVRADGLVPNAGGMFGGFYANYSAGKVFLTERGGVSYWQEKVGQQLEAAMDNPPPVVVLRIPKDKVTADLQPDTVGSADAGAPAFFATKPVFSRVTEKNREAAKRTSLAADASMMIHEAIKDQGTIPAWFKGPGTPYNLAKLYPAFNTAFRAMHRLAMDTSDFSLDAAKHAPNILPQLESIADVMPLSMLADMSPKLEGLRKYGKGPLAAKDAEALQKPVFEGTLQWMRDGMTGQPVKVADYQEQVKKRNRDREARNEERRAMFNELDWTTEKKRDELMRRGKLSQKTWRMWSGQREGWIETTIANKFEKEIVGIEPMEEEGEAMRPGIVWTPSELKRMFGLNDRQVGLYQETRKAIDASLDTLSVTEMVRMTQQPELRDHVMGMSPSDAAEFLRPIAEEQARQASLKVSSDTDKAEKAAEDAGNKITELADRADRLKEEGYAPLMRFGDRYVRVFEDGKLLATHFYESNRDRAADIPRLTRLYPKATLKQGTIAQTTFKLLKGVSPESMALFMEISGFDKEQAADEAFQAFYREAVSNNSALKRMIHRQGVPGYSEDVPRVLASFVTSNARLASRNLNTKPVLDAIESINPKDKQTGNGQLQDYANNLYQFLGNPQEQWQALRGLLFNWYLGGNISSMIVNMAQPFQTTIPELSKTVGVVRATELVNKAAATVSKKRDGELGEALKRAAQEGLIAPQEYFHLMAIASGSGHLQGGKGIRQKAGNALTRATFIWGRPFAWGEMFNRRVTFIAGYQAAKESGHPDPYAFSAELINETQFVYGMVNRPVWMRSGAGATLLTFQSYQINMLELMYRNAMREGTAGKKAFAVMLVGFLLAAGLHGLPFIGNLYDVIDGFAQRALGLNWQTEAKINEAIASGLSYVLKDETAESLTRFVGKGLSAYLPTDVSGRFSMARPIPGTGALTLKRNYGYDLMDVFGPAGSLLEQQAKAGATALTGRFGDALEDALPVAGQNMVKGAKMFATGEARDSADRKTVEVDKIDAAFKFFGLQPAVINEERNPERIQTRRREIAALIKSAIVGDMARALRDNPGKNAEQIPEFQAAIARWKRYNEKNPDFQIEITPQQVEARRENMTSTSGQRLLKSTPKGQRGAVAEGLGR